MKIPFRIFPLFLLVTVSVIYTGCKKDDDGSESIEKKQLDKLLGDWSIVSASDEEAPDRTADFSNLVLNIQGNYVEGGTYNYSFTGTRPDPSPWPESGTFKFAADKATKIIRDPGTDNEIEMSYQVSETELTFTFTVPDGADGWPGSGRIKNVIGQWTFVFEKQ